MQTVFVSFYDHEQDSLLPPSVRNHWREELYPIISRDIERGLFGERRFNLWSSSVVYKLDLPEVALQRIRSNLQLFAEDNMRYTANLREALSHASIWLSFDRNAIELNEDIRAAPSSQRNDPNRTMVIGIAYEAPPRSSTSSSRTVVGDDSHPQSAYSSTTTLATQSSSQYAHPHHSPKNEHASFSNGKASLDIPPSSSLAESSRVHPRQLPLDRRFKPTSEKSRAKKTHVVALDAESLEAFGGYGSLASPADTRRGAGGNRTVVGRFLRTLGLRKDASLPPRGRITSFSAHEAEYADDNEFDGPSVDNGVAPGLS